MYWPGMTKEIEDQVTMCATCQWFQRSNVKEPLQSHEISRRPQEILATDIMTLNNRDYLLVVDYYLKYVEVPILKDKTARSVITALKSVFARHGIPDTC